MSETTFTVYRDELKVVMERVFDAPRDLVWKIITDPEFIPKWWGPERHPTVVEQMDVQINGRWRYICEVDGNEMAFSGIYKEIDPPFKLVQTFNFEPIGPGHESTETAVLEETPDGKTKLTMTSVYNTIHDLEGTVESGMEGGARESWERLVKIVATVAQSV